MKISPLNVLSPYPKTPPHTWLKPTEVLGADVDPLVAQIVDFFYLPGIHRFGINLGYGFANFRTPALFRRFREIFLADPPQFPGNSAKTLQITVAKVQGMPNLRQHFTWQEWGGEKYPIFLPSTGEISCRCFTGCHEYF